MLWVPQPDRFAADGDTSLGKKILDISMTKIESVVEPDGVADDFRRESGAFVSIHAPILSIMGT